VRRMSHHVARKIALAAQGFADPRPAGRIDRRHFRRLFRQVGLLQLDSVNVVARAHYLTAFARLGPYDPAALDAYTAGSGEIFEYWAHEASLLPVERHPLLRWRMEERKPWHRIQDVLAKHPDYLDVVYDEIATHGPRTVGELDDPGERSGPWWGHNKGKVTLEWLFSKGRLTAYRTANFTRVYDLPERVIPAVHLDAATPDRGTAHRELLLLAARHHGIGTAADLADYYRLHLPTSRKLLHELAGAGHLVEVDVAGWRHPAYLHPEARRPRHVTGAALLCPFDSLIWKRDRTERIFGMRYRIEVYVPQPKRVHGYYVLPFLLDGQLVARVDLKADRAGGALLVRAAHLEDGADPGRVAPALVAEARTMADWLGLDDVAVGTTGNLAAALRRAAT